MAHYSASISLYVNDVFGCACRSLFTHEGQELAELRSKYSGQLNVIARRLANVRCVLEVAVPGSDSRLQPSTQPGFP